MPADDGRKTANKHFTPHFFLSFIGKPKVKLGEDFLRKI